MKNEGREKFKTEFAQRAYWFGLRIIKTVESLDAKNITCRIIGNQVLRSATSIGANIIEARGSSSTKDYANFFSYALKSANETRYWLELLRDSNKLDETKANELIREATELTKVLAKSIMTMRNNK